MSSYAESYIVRFRRTTLLGPARKDQKWQVLAGEVYAAADFQIDWLNQQATCPQGHTSQSWFKTAGYGQACVFIKFSRKHYVPCPVRHKCTRMKRWGIKLHANAPDQALQAAR